MNKNLQAHSTHLAASSLYENDKKRMCSQLTHNNTGNSRRIVLLAGLVVVLISGLLATIPIFYSLEESLGLSWLFKLRGSQIPPEDVVIVAMNADSATALGLPAKADRWPRSIHAQVVETLHQYGASVIILDLAFKAPRSGSQDQILAKAIANAGNVVLFKYLKRTQQAVVNHGQQIAIMDTEVEIHPIDILAKEAAAIASFTLPKAPNRVNWAQLYGHFTQGTEATLPLIVLQLHSRPQLVKLRQLIQQNTSGTIDAELLDNQADPQIFARSMHRIFTDEPDLAHRLKQAIEQNPNDTDQELLTAMIDAYAQVKPVYINFYGPERTLTTLPYHHLLGKISPEQTLPNLKNKVVFVGFSEPQQTEQLDTYYTVFSTRQGVDLSGVEISATVFANLLERRLLHPLPLWQQIGLILCWGILLFSVVINLPIKSSLFLQLLLCALYFTVALTLFGYMAVWLPLITPLLFQVPLVNGTALIVRYMISQHERETIATALSHYLPNEVAQSLSHDVRRFQERHQLVQGICLLTDIKGYTEISESLPPDVLHRIMNNYYTTLVSQVDAQQGNVANIVGDGMLAIWTASKLSPELKAQACHTALAISRALDNKKFENISLPTCIGLHCGAFSLGNLGAVDHFEYAPVGDIVNTTARIEALNRMLGTRILSTTEFTEDLHDFVFRPLGNFEVKNKNKPLYVCELMGTADNLSHEGQKQLYNFQEALLLYKQSHWEAAQQGFEDLLHYDPGDGPSQYYVNQCRKQLQANAT